MSNKLNWAVVAAFAGLTHGVFAGTAANVPNLDQVLAASGITEQGYVEAGYDGYNFAAPGAGNNAPTTLNTFDNKANTFALKQAYLQLAKQPSEGFGGLVNVIAGSDADQIKSYPYSNGSAANSLDLTQAFLQYASGMYTVQAGKFVTLAGAEGLNDATNTNISHSISFLHAIPFTHTGVRLTVAPTQTLSFIIGEVNGWYQQQSQNRQKTTELGVAFNPNSMLNWTLQDYYGDATTNGATTNVGYSHSGKMLFAQNNVLGQRNLVDTVLTIKPTSLFSVVLNGDYGTQEHAFANSGMAAKWYSGDLYLNSQITDQWRTSLRFEDFNDQEGYILGYGAGNTKSTTLTVAYAPTKNSEVRAEIRDDHLPGKVVQRSNGSMTDNVGYGAIEGIYKF